MTPSSLSLVSSVFDRANSVAAIAAELFDEFTAGFELGCPGHSRAGVMALVTPRFDIWQGEHRRFEILPDGRLGVPTVLVGPVFFLLLVVGRVARCEEVRRT